MKPVFALVGRPNVGKSTLFNRLTASRDALTVNLPGLTRDRQYGEGEIDGRKFLVIDMGGITPSPEGLEREVVTQALQAIAEADCVLFLVDARDGLTPEDSRIHQFLREQGKPGFLVVNKTDGLDPDQARAEFHELGEPEVFAIAAAQGAGVKQLMRQALDRFEPEEHAEPVDVEDSIRITFAGRPNVGKSTLVNRLLGEDRVLVFDEPGTTRDSIEIPFERDGRRYTLIDTAGIRRRGKTRGVVEKFSVVKSLQAIEKAHVVVFLADAREGVVEQDLHLLGYVVETGRALVIAFNKWDGMEAESRQWLKREIERRLGFVDYAPMHFISALHGTGVGDLYESIHAARASSGKTVSTNVLTRMLETIVDASPPPLARGRRIRLRYAHLGGHNPPLIVIHGKQLDKLPGHYRRYLQNSFRQMLELRGVSVKIELRNDDNPYARSEENLNARQVARKRRVDRNRR